MEPIRIPITLSPHIVGGKPRGYYLLAQRLFLGNVPILRRDQFIGMGRSLIVTVARHNAWNSLVQMGIFVKELNQQPIIWLGTGKLYPMNKGFRMYIPSSILSPVSKEKIETTGIFDRQDYGGNVESLFYLMIPKITEEIMTKKRRLE